MDDLELREVFESTNPGLIALAKSLLEGAAIDYVAVGDDVAAVFAGNPMFGRVSIRVAEERADEAEALLAELSTERER